MQVLAAMSVIEVRQLLLHRRENAARSDDVHWMSALRPKLTVIADIQDR
jgi:hypothetical protein